MWGWASADSRTPLDTRTLQYKYGLKGHPRNKPTDWLVEKSSCQTPKFGNHPGRAGPGQPQNFSVWVYPVFVFVCLVCCCLCLFLLFCCGFYRSSRFGGTRTPHSGGQARPGWFPNFVCLVFLVCFFVFVLVLFVFCFRYDLCPREACAQPNLLSIFFNYALLRRALVVHLKEPGKVARPGGQWFVYRGLYTQLFRRSDTTNVSVTYTGRTQVPVAYL